MSRHPNRTSGREVTASQSWADFGKSRKSGAPGREMKQNHHKLKLPWNFDDKIWTDVKICVECCVGIETTPGNGLWHTWVKILFVCPKSKKIQFSWFFHRLSMLFQSTPRFRNGDFRWFPGNHRFGTSGWTEKASKIDEKIMKTILFLILDIQKVFLLKHATDRSPGSFLSLCKPVHKF